MRAAYIPLEAAKNGESTAKRGLWGSRENSSSPGREPPASGPLAPAAAAGRQARAVVRRLPATLSMAAAAAFLSGGWIGWVERRSGRGEAAWWRHGVDENCRRRERKKKTRREGEHGRMLAQAQYSLGLGLLAYVGLINPRDFSFFFLFLLVLSN